MPATFSKELIFKPLGEYGQLIASIFKDLVTKGVSFREFLKQVVLIGYNSFAIVFLTNIFTGMVLALQTAHGLERFGAKLYVGNIVSLAQVRELGPVLTAIMLCGRVGAGVAAEIASMVVTEQVDAIKALGANPIRKLVSPRLVAAIVALPLLTVMADFIGIIGGGLVAVYELNLNAHIYYRSIINFVTITDVMDGVIKSAAFGFIFVSIACFKGLHARGGTEGVGKATTEAVVVGSIAILISNYFLTKLLILFE
ncbi:MAG: ABC transporter permease [bacterium]|nr:ABC transporter permease [bacterium]